MMRKSFLALTVTAALTIAVFAASSAAPKPVTVGEFAVKVARVMGASSADSKAAAATLKNLGVNLGVNLDANLTEAQAARILGDLGLKVSTTHPTDVVTLGKANSLASLASAATIQSSVIATDLPTQCLQQPNRGTCVDCCKAVVGQIENNQGKLQDPGLLCTKFCSSVIPPGLVSDPEPSP